MSELALQLIAQEQQEKTGRLDLGNCGLTSIPEELFELTWLIELSLSNKIWSIDKNKFIKSSNGGQENNLNCILSEKFQNFNFLIKLNLSGNHGRSFILQDASVLGKISVLKTLELNYTYINNYNFLEKLTGLISLDLSYNQISDINILGNLTSLQTLYLSGSHISNVSFLKNLTNIQTLYLSSNQISDISSLENLTKLKSLHLSVNQIKNYNFLKNLKGLKTLYLSVNSISDISFIEKLTALQTLILGDNKIRDLSILKNLTNLQTLDLRDNQVSDISILKNLTSLRSLNLLNNQINNIQCFKKLLCLKNLDLSINNQITNFSFLENLVELNSLRISFNQIKNIDFLEKMKGLKLLDLSYNQISNIKYLENLTGLQQLVLRNNYIKDIKYLEKLSELKYLDLCDNSIKDIKYFANLTRLKYLYLLDNEISDISPIKPLVKKGISVGLIHGAGILIGNNPTDIPPEIVNQGNKAVLDWFEAKKKKLEEIKIILIGKPNAGKTSLLRRLKDDSFNEYEVQTDGINIEDIQFGGCETFKHQKTLHKLTGHFWDFGGQEIINTTHQFFLSKRSIYILVLDARNDTNVSTQIRNWVKRITATGGNSSIIIVANHVDENPGFGFENEYDLRNEFHQIKHFIRTSCKTKENIDLIKYKLEELIPLSELFITHIDERWISIKEKLQEETKSSHFLDETRFLEICRKFNLNDRQGQKYAIAFLNDLGLVLHFEDLNLSEYYVLDPYWITYGVYQILTSAYAGKNKGLVCMGKLEYIVNEEEDKKKIFYPANYIKIYYSNNQRRFLVDILNQFKLCFYLRDHSHFIIPDLLDTDEPIEVTEPIRNSEDGVRFIYEYEYLPKSIMPYIIVDTHQVKKEIWRTGCLLQMDGCSAIITSYGERISILVNGGYKRKRDFLAYLRHQIDLINQKMNVNPKMLIPLPDTDEFVDYEELLGREKDGEKFHTLYKPVKKKFEISVLLYGIPSMEEVSNNDLLLEIKKINSGIEEINNTLDNHYQYLINFSENNGIKNEIIKAVDEANAIQSQDLKNDITQCLAEAFTDYNGEMKDELSKIYTDLKQTDDFQMKLKLFVPFIRHLGVNFEAEINLKNLAKKMYSKHKLKIFKLMGYL